MNTPVSFEISKELKEKGFNEKTIGAYVDTTPFSENEKDFTEYVFPQNHNEKEHRTSAPTIAEAVMWLYEKHGIWISVDFNLETSWFYDIVVLLEEGGNILDNFNSPTEAYEAAIDYILKNLI